MNANLFIYKPKNWHFFPYSKLILAHYEMVVLLIFLFMINRLFHSHIRKNIQDHFRVSGQFHENKITRLKICNNYLEQGGQTTNLRVGPHSPGWDPVHKGGTPITRVGPRSPGYSTPLPRVGHFQKNHCFSIQNTKKGKI